MKYLLLLFLSTQALANSSVDASAKPFSSAVSGNIVTSSVNIATNAYSDILTAANVTTAFNVLDFYNGCASAIIVAFGAAGSEVDKFYIAASTRTTYPWFLPKSTRVSLKAIGTTCSSGVVTGTALK